jgi:hypothetical protein
MVMVVDRYPRYELRGLESVVYQAHALKGVLVYCSNTVPVIRLKFQR